MNSSFLNSFHYSTCLVRMSHQVVSFMPQVGLSKLLPSQFSKWKSLSSAWLFETPWTYNPWNSPGQNTRVGNHSLLQGIVPTQGSNPDLPHCRWILYQLSHQRSARILEWVAIPFSRGSSQPRNWTGVSCIAGGFFTNWAMKEAPELN